jgi:hypothetical protein
MVVDNTHPDKTLTQGATLFSARKEKSRTSNSICDTNGLRVVDKNNKGVEIVLFYCLVGTCANMDCSGTRIPIDANSTAHATLQSLILICLGIESAYLRIQSLTGPYSVTNRP